MLERFAICTVLLVWQCLKALIVVADVIIGILSWLAGESHEEANRGSDTLEPWAERDSGPVDAESNRETDRVRSETVRIYCGEHYE